MSLKAVFHHKEFGLELRNEEEGMILLYLVLANTKEIRH